MGENRLFKSYMKISTESVVQNVMDILNETGKQMKDRFRKYGDIAEHTAHVHIRAVQDADKEKFLELQTETCIAKSGKLQSSY